MASKLEYLFDGLELLRQPVFVLGLDRKCIFANKSFLDLISWPQSRAALTTESFCKELSHFPDLLNEQRTRLQSSDGELSVLLKFGDISQELILVEVIAGSNISDEFHSQRLMTLGMLAGGVAHDFNNILAGVLGHVTYLKSVLPDAGRYIESLDAIEEGGKRASFITREILNFSRQRAQDQASKIDLGGSISSICTLLRGAISPQIKIQWNIPENPIFVTGIPGRVSQVIANLVMNAKDAIDDSGWIAVDLQVLKDLSLQSALQEKTKNNKSFAVLTVSDNGKGMPEEVMARIFEPYFTSGKELGTGLGLEIVQRVVTSLEGVIKVDSVLGRGTTVNIYLPFDIVEATSTTVSDNDLDLPRGTAKVLIIDDEPGVRHVLAMSLKHLGYQVETADSGRSGLGILELDPTFDLVLLDMLMPKLSGEQVYERLHRLYPDLAVLVVSGYSSETAVQRILAKGGKGFLPKPFTIKQLAETVCSCLNKPA